MLFLLVALVLIGNPAPGIASAGSLPTLAPARSANLDGVTVNYTSTATDPNDLTLILIHGFSASLETWNDVYPSLSRQFPVVRLDLKGHGFSSKPMHDDYTWDEQARLVAAFITRLGFKRVVLVGHSLGGGIALLACLQHQDRAAAFDIAGLILISSAGYPQELPFFIAAMRDPVTRYLLYLIPPETRVRYVLERIVSVTSRVTADRVHRYAYFLDLPGSRNALERTVKHIVPPDSDELAGRFKRISVPTLIVWGEEDRVVPVRNGRRFSRDLKNSRLKILPQTGHLPHEERPDRVLEEVRDFVRTLR